MLNNLGFFKVLQYLIIIDLHALHFRIFKVLQLGFLKFYKQNILGFF